MSDTVSITITETPDAVTVDVSDNLGDTYSIFEDDASTVTQVDTSLTLSTYTARPDVHERVRVFTGGRARKYNRPYGWGISGTNITFLGSDGSTPTALLSEDYIIIIRKL